MNNGQTFSISTLAMVASLFFAPSLAQANAAWHQGRGDIVRFTPEHVNANTRAQVISELDAARRDGTLRFLQLALPAPAKSVAEPKTRQQVVNEMLNQPADQRRALNELYRG